MLDISQTELAQRASVGVATIKKVENSGNELRVMVRVLQRIEHALERAGIIFIDQDENNGPGVRLRRRLP